MAYDREYTTRAGTTVRRRLGYSHDHGEVTRFVVQLEYLYEDGWTPVVHYDHDPASMHGHDVTDEGLHLDVYRDGETYRQEYVAPPMPAGVALDFAEDLGGEPEDYDAEEYLNDRAGEPVADGGE